MKSARLNRLFNPRTRRCFDVAIDHGFFNEATFLAGIEDLPGAIAKLVAAGPDADPAHGGPGAAPAGAAGPRQAGARPAHRCRQRLRDAAALVALLAHGRGPRAPGRAPRRGVRRRQHLFCIPDQPGLADQCLQNILRIKPECDYFGMPLMIEPLVFQPNAKAGGYMVDGDPSKIIPLVRQAVELGADIIKADPTDDVSIYHKVVEVAGGVPVLVRGGGRAPEGEILERTAALLKQGASGIVYGRNIIQHPNPAGITRALMAVVHDGATPSEAMALLS